MSDCERCAEQERAFADIRAKIGTSTHPVLRKGETKGIVEIEGCVIRDWDRFAATMLACFDLRGQAVMKLNGCVLSNEPPPERVFTIENNYMGLPVEGFAWAKLPHSGTSETET